MKKINTIFIKIGLIVFMIMILSGIHYAQKSTKEFKTAKEEAMDILKEIKVKEVIMGLKSDCISVCVDTFEKNRFGNNFDVGDCLNKCYLIKQSYDRKSIKHKNCVQVFRSSRYFTTQLGKERIDHAR